MLDVARNFMPMETLRQTIDSLRVSKMNVLHLHLSDSQSFPLELTSGRGPDLTAAAAYSPNQTYSPADIASLHAYATANGVVLIPEIDTPGHARSFGVAPGAQAARQPGRGHAPSLAS
jgi:hexosaminidase